MSLQTHCFEPACSSPSDIAREVEPCPSCALIEERMAPDPRAVLAAFLDLDVTEAEIARYFAIPQACIASYLQA